MSIFEKKVHMLIYFKVGNFKSIREPITIDFNAASISEHPNSNVVTENKLSLLKTVMLYGHNASGKSKILDAFVFYKWFVNVSSERELESIEVENFELNSSNDKKPSFFEALFIIGKTKYRYGFEVTQKRITKEWLLESTAKKEYPVFLRINDEFKIDFKRFKDSNGLEKRTRSNSLFLSVASQWNVKKAKTIKEWFGKIYAIHGLRDNGFQKLTIDLLKDKKYSSLIHKFIQIADLGIDSLDLINVDVKIDDIIKKAPEELKSYYKNKFKDKEQQEVLTLHHKYNNKNEKVGTVPFMLNMHESEGTRKYFNLIGVFIKSILEDRLVVVDEFDARFHTLLSKSILKLFNSSKSKSKAQLFVASHDTALLDNDILRRDQIYFVEKNNFGETQVTSLVEFKTRKESPYYKNYLEGKYGAIPFIGDIEKLLENGKKTK